MPLPIYDSQDAVPEDQREDYAEHEGKWRHKVEIEVLLEKGKRQTLLSEKKEEERLRKEAQRKLQELETERQATNRGVSEEALKEIREKEAEGRKPLQDRIKELEGEVHQLKFGDRIQKLYLDNGGSTDRLEEAMFVLGRRADLGDEGGFVFKDKDGKITADTPETFFKKLKIEKKWLFRGTGSSGGGAGEDNLDDDRELPPDPTPTPRRTEQDLIAATDARIRSAL